MLSKAGYVVERIFNILGGDASPSVLIVLAFLTAMVAISLLRYEPR